METMKTIPTVFTRNTGGTASSQVTAGLARMTMPAASLIVLPVGVAAGGVT